MTRSKVCFKCGIKKPLEDFYKHSMMGDGRLGKCKECTKRDVAEHRAANIDRIRAYDKERAKLPHRKENASSVTSKWRQADRRRMKCHNAVTRAVRAGLLRKHPCSRCDAPKALAHHESYDHALDVVWLCQPCHKKRHAEMKAEGIIP